jgi:hypothetical protein
MLAYVAFDVCACVGSGFSGMYSVPSWNDFEPREDAAQYWRFVQASPGCPKKQQPGCNGAPYGKHTVNNSVREFHRRNYPEVETCVFLGGKNRLKLETKNSRCSVPEDILLACVARDFRV